MPADLYTSIKVTEYLEYQELKKQAAKGGSPLGLTFTVLRSANLLRLSDFKNAQGEIAHSESDGSDWLLSQWCNAVCGELGEAANLIKKIERGDFTHYEGEVKDALAEELADIVTYLDLLAYRAGVDLGRATIEKFNKVSDRVSSTIYIREDGSGTHCEWGSD